MSTLKTIFIWTPLSLVVVLIAPALALVWIVRVRLLESAATRRRAVQSSRATDRARRHACSAQRPAAAKALRLVSAMVLAAGVACAVVAGVAGGYTAIAPGMTLLVWLAIAWLVPFALAHVVEFAARGRGAPQASTGADFGQS